MLIETPIATVDRAKIKRNGIVHGWLAFQSPTTKNQKMVLTRPDILDYIKSGDIVIEPLHMDDVGTNSVDLHLSKFLMTIDNDKAPLDVKKPANITLFEIDDMGALLVPGMLYLASTLERTHTKKHLPTLHGKSSVARLGISVHDAGFGDVGFKGHWTLEITVAQPIRIYHGMPICQICYEEIKSMPDVDYMDRKASSYTTAWDDPKPQPSKLYKKF